MNKFDESMRFYLLATELTRRIRSGWDDTHWNIQAVRLESIAEHVYSTVILAISIDSMFDTHVDMNRVIKMLALHEIGEAIIGDITPFDNVTPEEKERKEHEAMYFVLGNLIARDELYNLLLEFDAHETPESIFAYYCDKLQANIQSKWYQDNGFQKSLDEQENNVAYKSKKCQDIIKNGAKTPFDVWYASDVSLFNNDPIFTGFMNWLKSNNISDTHE